CSGKWCTTPARSPLRQSPIVGGCCTDAITRVAQGPEPRLTITQYEGYPMSRMAGAFEGRQGCRGGRGRDRYTHVPRRRRRLGRAGFRFRAIEPDRPRTRVRGRGRPSVVAVQLHPSTPINSRCLFDFWPPCRRPFILKRGNIAVRVVAT